MKGLSKVTEGFREAPYRRQSLVREVSRARSTTVAELLVNASRTALFTRWQASANPDQQSGVAGPEN